MNDVPTGAAPGGKSLELTPTTVRVRGTRSMRSVKPSSSAILFRCSSVSSSVETVFSAMEELLKNGGGPSKFAHTDATVKYHESHLGGNVLILRPLGDKKNDARKLLKPNLNALRQNTRLPLGPCFQLNRLAIRICWWSQSPRRKPPAMKDGARSEVAGRYAI